MRLLCWSILFVAILSGCTDPEEGRFNGDSGSDAADSNVDSRLDASEEDTEPQDGTETDVSHDGGEVDASNDTIDFDETLWQTDSGCEGKTSLPDITTEDYSVPDRPQTVEPIMTREGWFEYIGRTATQGFAIIPGSDLEPGSPPWFDLYSRPGSPANFHVYVYNNFTEDELESFRLSMTVMLDYEPVESEYVVWDSERREARQDVVSTGINFDIQQDVEIIDVRLPGNVLQEPGVREITVMFSVNTNTRVPFGASQRFFLYNGSYERDQVPCHEPRLDDDWVDIERDFLPVVLGTAVGPLFHKDLADALEARSTIQVEGGEELEIYFSHFRTHSGTKPTPTVLIPTLNGRPLEERWWVTQGQEIRSDGTPEKTDARKSFNVVMPEEAGIYEVQVMTSADPFRLYRDPSGQVNEQIYFEGGIEQHSNALRFEVVENVE